MCSFSTLSEVQPQAANDDAGLNKLYEIKCTLTNPPLSEFIKSRMSTCSMGVNTPLHTIACVQMARI